MKIFCVLPEIIAAERNTGFLRPLNVEMIARQRILDYEITLHMLGGRHGFRS